jgi:Fe-S oxidoreductase
VRRTLRLLDHLGCSYTVLGGVTSCCGAPHLLQGEFDQADQCLEQLYQKIKTVQPKLILTSCAECYEALEKLKREKNEVFELLSVVEYLSQNIDKFPKVRMQGTTLVHDSCRFKKDSRHGQAARITVETFGDLKEQENTQGSPCCYQWNHGYDPGNTSRQKKYLEDVRTSVSTLACTCITCYEELKKLRTDVEVIDVVQLYENALDAKPSKEKT